MEFRILGQLQVLDGEQELLLGSAKERALLTVLLLNAGAVVSRERLVDELWGESPPPTAGKALNVHVSQLRKTLARNGDAGPTPRSRRCQAPVDLALAASQSKVYVLRGMSNDQRR